ncbi:MAG: peptidyl-prolyl cis-trans isomerase [Phycisphaerales bacterium]
MSGSMRGVERAEASVRTGGSVAASGERPVAVVGGEPIRWEALRPYLAEAGGGAALEEAALDVLLSRECAARGIVIGAGEIDAERIALERAMSESGAGAVTEVRRARGLGPARWEGLLRRNAMLRALVRGEARVSEAEIAREYALRHGERVRALLLTTRTAGDAARAVDRVRAGESFSRVAAELSTDVSAARGGVIEPINLEDPTYPEALRKGLGGARDGEMTGVIALDGGFAVLLREGSVGGRGPGLDAVREEMGALARARQERALMGRFARELLEGSRVGVLDPGMGWSWEGRTGANNPVGR